MIEPTRDGREMYRTLGVSQYFGDWARERIAEFDLVDGVDYRRAKANLGPGNHLNYEFSAPVAALIVENEPKLRLRDGDHYGYLYVVEFSTGTVKIGRTRCFKKRVKEHAADARRFGVSVTRSWSSKGHGGVIKTEFALVCRCEAIESASLGRREYFAIPFNVAVSLAKRMVREHGEAVA